MSSDNRMEVRWEVEDGYAGKSRPQSFEIDLEDFAGCESDAEYERVLNGYMQEEFMNRIAWHCYNYDDVIEAAKLYNQTEED